jgi:fructokinase
VIIVAGEALIDRIAWPDGRVMDVPGGGPFNAARTMARLGAQVGFVGRLSRDAAGTRIRAVLEADGVDTRWVVTTDDPTTTAEATLDRDGAATYRFALAGTSAVGLEIGEVLAALGSDPDAIHVGTLGLAVQPMATAIAAAVRHLARRPLLMVDPNCRPAVIGDRAAYLDRLATVIARADVAKVSVDDLAFIAPGKAPEVAARSLIGHGPALALLTDGPRPVRIVAADATVEIPVPAVRVVDTVGSGDAFGGAFLARFMERSGTRRGLSDAAIVHDAVERAIEVAVWTCQRSGADPPRRADIGWSKT